MDDDQRHASISIGSQEDQERLQEKMEEIRIKEKEQEAQNKAQLLNLSYINLKGFPVAPEILSLISKEEAIETRAVCIYQNKKDLRVAVLDPMYPKTAALLEQLSKEYDHVMVYVVSQHSMDLAIKLYDAIPKHREYIAGVRIEGKELLDFRKQVKTITQLGGLMQKAQFAQLVTLTIAGAIESRSSDIHVEAEADDVKIRYRIDGILHDISSLDKHMWRQLISRLKLLAKVKLNIANVPQDGRFTIHLPDEEIDVRVSFLPTGYGESVVMRILRSSSVSLNIEELGLRGEAYDILQEEIKRPNGMILTTGPTGSGKTTTLYAILTSINSPEKKIITLENPIEYRLKGINQSQVDEKAGNTFARGLRSILRQDPDIVMVGEIRDEETADIAVNAALTGHFVLSTLHTNNAAGAIPRFIAMDVKPYLLAPALNSVIAQRLVRRICKDCKEEMHLDEETLQRVKEVLGGISPKSKTKVDLANLKFYHGKGCEACQGIGYKGRIGIYELFTMSEEIEKLILDSRVSEFEMQRIAISQGMITMVQDGLLKALDGITTVEEIFNVAQ